MKKKKPQQSAVIERDVRKGIGDDSTMNPSRSLHMDKFFANIWDFLYIAAAVFLLYIGITFF